VLDTTVVLGTLGAVATGWAATTVYTFDLHHRLHTDAATGLTNRAGLAVLARRATATPARRTGTLGLLLADVDHFKQINDIHGHEVGTAVLAVLAHRLTAACRPGETAVRLHGDEFAIWLGHLPANGRAGRDYARQRAEEIRAGLGGEVRVGHRRLQPTVSIGAHTTPAAGLSLSALLAGADTAMYQAKHSRTAIPLHPTPSTAIEQETA